MKNLTIGELARRAEVGVETVRFYERRGLIQRPKRPLSGYRSYPEEAILKLQFIRRSKELGFSLREIKEFLNLRVSPKVTCREVRERAEKKVADIDERIHALQNIRQALQGVISKCTGAGPVSECPILQSFDCC